LFEHVTPYKSLTRDTGNTRGEIGTSRFIL